MAKKRARINNMKVCLCDKCGVSAYAMQDKPHRRCSGVDGGQIRPKHENLDSASRGHWRS
jgi:hypothetical protein